MSSLRSYELSSLQRTTKHICKLYYPDQCTMIIIHENYLAWMCRQRFFDLYPPIVPNTLVAKTAMCSSHIHTILLSLPFSLSGGHGVSFAPSGDDNHCANWRPVGRLPENPQPDDHHQCQEAHELWRWECQTKKGRPVGGGGGGGGVLKMTCSCTWIIDKLLTFGLKILNILWESDESLIFFHFLTLNVDAIRTEHPPTSNCRLYLVS